ncbi:hypothetical protein [Neorhodopirellula lusitana]|uniref:hypothetical protein n=1 Tax=Neorhodopirellula lusitana TaxID=445327 RepID=UPI00384AF9F3
MSQFLLVILLYWNVHCWMVADSRTVLFVATSDVYGRPPHSYRDSPVSKSSVDVIIEMLLLILLPISLPNSITRSYQCLLQ